LSAEEQDGEPIPLSRPWIGEAESAKVAQALAGRLSGDGPIGRRVEQRLQEITGARRVLLTTSCTHALELALLALGVGPGDEVICPSFTFVSTANAALRVGARPVFADIEEETLGLDPEDVARRVTPRTRVVLPVHYAGLPGQLEPLLALAHARGLRVVEDAAQAFDATWRGRALGTLGDAGCLSFHETKNITCGEGGALLLNDPQLAERAEVAREKGTNRSRFLRGEVDKYTWVAEGSSYILSDVLAALLDAQLDRRAAISERRAHLAARYRQELGSWARAHGVRFPAEPADAQPNHHIFFLLLPDAAARDRLLDQLRARRIGAAFHYVPLHSSPFGRTLAGDVSLPVTDRMAETLVRLPLYPQLREDQLARVCDAVRESH
jgi:dTDP-4-amino-4,6-dideoxygalactose transaminase